MQQPRTFGQCLSELMRIHQLSSTTLGPIVGGRTALQRLLREEVSDSRRTVALKKFKDLGLFADHELLALEKGLEISRIGVNRYLTRKSIRQLLFQDDQPANEVLRLADGSTLYERLHEMQSAQSLRILCINSCFSTLFTCLAPLFKFPGLSISMKHYVHLDQPSCDAASLINCVSPILFDKRYLPFGVSAETAAPCAQHIGGNLLLIHATQNGQIRESLFVIKSKTYAYELSGSAGMSMNLLDFLSQIVEDIQPRPQALKELHDDSADSDAFMMTCLSRELNRATYSLGYTPYLLQTPVDIAISALRDKALLPGNKMEQMIGSIIPLHIQRYHNFYDKKKPNDCIMSLEGCRAFLETGRSKDHSIGFRDFTPSERLKIFEDLLANARVNSYYRPLLLRESSYSNQFCIVCYDKLGVALYAANSQYDFTQGFDYVFLTFPEFTNQYQDFFLEELARDKCFSREESLTLLQSLADEYRERFAAI